ncbi:hypothetical protein SLA_4244 [Streptomyces laurentii]|uniref:Uncharacterized protein n=1 Tax=Streptomyces laurentii TaxID=39478 RepID=A0A169NRJ7_STRLU|nr:hypothetical protein SLA_4244 [Streptomyces laurentii]
MTTTPEPEAPETVTDAADRLGLRMVAGCGLALLLVCAFFVVTAVLGDAVGGDGVSSGFSTAAFWALALSGVAGLAALAVPRKGLVIAQYVLALGAPVLALLD